MQLKILKTEEDYIQSLQRFEEIFQAQPGSTESDEADVLALLLKEYEEQHYVINTPNPIEATKQPIERRG
jgi:HTH-type transcriptional regulator/antitoxin HigA